MDDKDPAEQGFADRLLAVGRDCAPRLNEPFRSVEHGDLLYDESGLPAPTPDAINGLGTGKYQLLSGAK